MKNALTYSILVCFALSFWKCSSDDDDEVNPNDTIPPTVINTNPVDGQENVLIDSDIRVTFSEPISEESVNSSSFRVNSNTSTVSGSYTVNDAVVTFSPSAPLKEGTEYDVTLNLLITDLADNSLSSTGFSFTTVPPPDTKGPEVVDILPENGAVDVFLTDDFQIFFSEPLSSSTLIAGETIRVFETGSNTEINGTISTGSRVVDGVQQFRVNYNLPELEFGKEYELTLTTGITDQNGNALASEYKSSFTTSSPPDNDPPTIVSFSPADNFFSSTTQNIVIVFSEEIDANTVNNSNFTLTRADDNYNVPRDVILSSDGTTVTIDPVDPLRMDSRFDIVVTTGVTDLAGNNLVNQRFETRSTPANRFDPPAIEGGDTNVDIIDNIVAVFDVNIDPSTVNSSNIAIRRTNSGTFLPMATPVVQNNKIILNPDATLVEFETPYVLQITTTGDNVIRDVDGNRPKNISEFTILFTTEVANENFFYTLRTGLSTNTNRLAADTGSPYQLFYTANTNFCNNAWKFSPLSGGGYSITHACPPFTQYLEGGAANGTASMNAPPSGGGIYTGQIWNLTKDTRSGAPNNSFRFRNTFLGSSWSLDGTSPNIGMKSTNSSAANQYWRLERR